MIGPFAALKPAATAGSIAQLSVAGGRLEHVIALWPHLGAHSVTLLLHHVVWATRRREPVIGVEHDEALERQLRNTATGLGVMLHACGAADDHVHVLVQPPPELSLAILVQRLKGASSHALRHALRVGWQAGYWAESVSMNDVQATIRYIGRQREHHAATSNHERWETACMEAAARRP